MLFVSPRSAEALVRWDGKIKVKAWICIALNYDKLISKALRMARVKKITVLLATHYVYPRMKW